MEFQYTPSGVCSRNIRLVIEDDIIKDVEFTGGCNGNLKGIASLVIGQKTDDVIKKLSGIKCGFKNTSCPDQLSKALLSYKNQKG